MQVTASWRSLSCFLRKVAVAQHRLLRYISTGLTTELISSWEQLMPERRPTAAGLTTHASLCFLFHKNQQAMQVCPLCRQCASPALHTPESGSIYCRLTAMHTESGWPLPSALEMTAQLQSCEQGWLNAHNALQSETPHSLPKISLR